MKMMRRKKRPATLVQEGKCKTVEQAAGNHAVDVQSTHVDISIYVESVSGEYTRGLQALTAIGPCVTIFGSARTRPGEPAYADAMLVGRQLAMAGFAVATGGGGGIMEAANRGAALGGGGSIGMPIVLPFEESGNEFLELSVTFDHFPARKTCLIQACDAVVVFAGGFGTLDELFEVLTLIQTKKIEPVPIVLVGSYFWSGLLEWLVATPGSAGCISEHDIDLMIVVDTAGAAIEAVTSQLAMRAER